MGKLAINGGSPEIKSHIKEKWNDIRSEDIEKIKLYLENEPISVIDGGILKEFEEKFAEFIGVKYAVAYCNGTAALHAASFACGANSSSNFLYNRKVTQKLLNMQIE